MRSSFISDTDFSVVLRLLTHENALCCLVALETGLRISDVLAIRTKQIKQKSFTVREQKTGKCKRIKLDNELRQQLVMISGSVYVFQHRTDPTRHRTRQAVYLDLKRAAKALRLSVNLTPHSTRKNYAVGLYGRYGDLKVVQTALNHSHLEDTLLYCLSDVLQSSERLPKRRIHK